MDDEETLACLDAERARLRERERARRMEAFDWPAFRDMGAGVCLVLFAIGGVASIGVGSVVGLVAGLTYAVSWAWHAGGAP